MKQCSCPSSAFSVNSLSLLCRESSCIHYIEPTDRGELHNLSKSLPISACYFRIPCTVVDDLFLNVKDYIKTTCIIFRERWYAVSSTDCIEKKKKLFNVLQRLFIWHIFGNCKILWVLTQNSIILAFELSKASQKTVCTLIIMLIHLVIEN